MPGPTRRWVYGFIALIVVAITLTIAIWFFYTAFGRAWFAAGVAASNIAQHGRSQVEDAYQMSLVDGTGGVLVYLWPYTDPSLAHGIGCGLVRSELVAAGLPDGRWLILSDDDIVIADSRVSSCP